MSELLPEVFGKSKGLLPKTLSHHPSVGSVRAEDEESELEGKGTNAALHHYSSLSHFDASVTITYERDHYPSL